MTSMSNCFAAESMVFFNPTFSITDQTCTRLPVDPASMMTAYVCAFEFADSITNENKPKNATKIATESAFTWKGDIADGMVFVRKCINISGKDWFFSSPNGFFLFFIFIASDDDDGNDESVWRRTNFPSEYFEQEYE